MRLCGARRSVAAVVRPCSAVGGALFVDTSPARVVLGVLCAAIRSMILLTLGLAMDRSFSCWMHPTRVTHSSSLRRNHTTTLWTRAAPTTATPWRVCSKPAWIQPRCLHLHIKACHGHSCHSMYVPTTNSCGRDVVTTMAWCDRTTGVLFRNISWGYCGATYSVDA